MGEVRKRIPRETLTNGGRFVIVASASTNGRKGENDRRGIVAKEAALAGIPDAEIEVIGSERLTIWCNQHPAIAAYWAGRPDGLWTLDDWSRSEEHQVPWQASADLELQIATLRSQLDFESGSVYHLHIQGLPGVGKTRFALELCRGASWCDSVIYVRQASDIRLLELIDGAAAEQDVRLMVVADEVQPEQLLPLRDSVGRANGRIRLISVGHSPTPDPRRIPAVALKALDPQRMGSVVKGWYPMMPQEHVDFVVRFADGYVRLARLTADAVVQSATIDVRGLLKRDEIRGLLDRMLGTGDRRALYVVAVLASVGWTEDKQREGEAIAQHFGLDFDSVRSIVDDFNRRFGIAPRSGRYRYISPTPLGIHLAVEAWETYPDKLKALPAILPSEEATHAYYQRLQSIASNTQAREFAREQLQFFFRIDDFLDTRSVRRWSALSSANPSGAARNIMKALNGASVEDRKQLEDDARRQVVWTLVQLAWNSSSFHDAIIALALLSEAENETWANNASAEFIARFQIFLGGTAVPYQERLWVLDELLQEKRPALTKLVIQALVQASNTHASRMGGDPISDALPEQEWRPRTNKELLDCAEAAFTKLIGIAEQGSPEIATSLVAAAEKLAMMLRQSAVRELVGRFYDTVRRAYPESREPLRRAIANIINGERKYWKQLSTQQLEEIEALHARFEENTLQARLQQQVGGTLWDSEPPDLRPLAQELVAAPDVLAKEWQWLTSGEASGAWWLGEALSTEDPNGDLAQMMPAFPEAGPDKRVICGYVGTRRRLLGDDWYNNWLTQLFEGELPASPLVLEVTWRCGATEPAARIVASVLRTQNVSAAQVGQLGLGRWAEDLTPESVSMVLEAMAETGHRETAIAILAQRIKSHAEEIKYWKKLALRLVTASDIIRSGQMTNYYWKQISTSLVPDYAAAIATAIFREHANRESGAWFAEHSEAVSVLQAAAERDAIGVWRALEPHLSSRIAAASFTIGFPSSVLDRMPFEEVASWISGNPEERVPMMAGLISIDLSRDDTIASKVIAQYGDNEYVSGAFFSAYISGTWWGPASSHWEELANALESAAARTALPKVRRWALDHARELRDMARRDREREEEQEIRRR